jgi:inward rectifier potassium channel
MEQHQHRARRGRIKPLSAEAIRAIERRGITRHGLKDLYYDLMTMPLPALLGLLGLYFVAVNLIFASVYALIGGLAGVPGGDYGRFASAFFFSVQAFSTTGFSTVYPVSLPANVVVTVEILLGQINLAVSTGVFFARLSRPRPRVLFSKVMVVREIGGVQTLMFRVANQRREEISEAHMSVVMLMDEDEAEGGVMRRMLPLKLERDFSPVFALSWMVSHKITQDSPLWGRDRESLAAAGNVFVCLLTGTDEALSATITAKYVYGAEDVRFNHRFIDVVTRSPGGGATIDYRRFHDTVPVHRPEADTPDVE